MNQKAFVEKVLSDLSFAAQVSPALKQKPEDRNV